MNTAAQRAAEYLRQRAQYPGPVSDTIASPRLYPTKETQPLTVADLQELIATSLDIEKHIRDIKAAAWDEAARYTWHPCQQLDRILEANPYRD
jgi:hypothetical protein